MPNRWTRVPDEQPPALRAPASLLVPIADAFMVAMLSRPATGSLRATWVTPATLWLALVAAAAAAALVAVSVISLMRDGGWLPIAALIAGVALLIGAAAVAVVGAAQRRTHG